jgi:hypothetical protein
MTTMTKRERILRTFQCEEVDRIATYDIIENDEVIEHYTGEKVTPLTGQRVKAKAIARCLDMTRMVSGPGSPGEYTDGDGMTWRTERWTSWVEKRPFTDME